MQESYGKISVSEAPCGEPETARLGVREREIRVAKKARTEEQ
jgi:hypothetical protein